VAYSVRLTRAAEKELRRLSADGQRQVRARIDALEEDPRPAGVRKLGGRTEDWRIRVGPYRIVYRIRDEVLEVVVIHAGHRREVYRRG